MSSRLSTGYSNVPALFGGGRGEGGSKKKREKKEERRKNPISYKNHENHFT